MQKWFAKQNRRHQKKKNSQSSQKSSPRLLFIRRREWRPLLAPLRRVVLIRQAKPEFESLKGLIPHWRRLPAAHMGFSPVHLERQVTHLLPNDLAVITAFNWNLDMENKFAMSRTPCWIPIRGLLLTSTTRAENQCNLLHIYSLQQHFEVRHTKTHPRAMPCMAWHLHSLQQQTRKPGFPIYGVARTSQPRNLVAIAK